LGKGKTQQQAISEIQAFPENDPIRNETLELLSVWRIFIDTKNDKTTDEEELLMNLSPIYQQWRENTLQEGKQEGRREFVEDLLSTRFGELDESLSRLVKPLLMKKHFNKPWVMTVFLNELKIYQMKKCKPSY